MSVEVRPATGNAKVAIVTFRLPINVGLGASVVGSFNDWDPSVHKFRKVNGSTMRVRTTLPPGRHEFRYVYHLDHSGRDHWFDEVDAPKDGQNCVLEVGA